MRIRLLPIGIALLVLAGGCCDSKQPLYTPETIKRDLDLAGTWEGYDPRLEKFDSDSPITIAALGDGKFEARWSENLGDAKTPRVEKHSAILRGVELNGSLYLDIELLNPAQDPLPVFLAGEHQIVLAQLEGDRLQLASLDRHKVKACAAADNLHFTSGEWGAVTLDEPTASLQKFVTTHRNKIFELSGEARRVARPQAAD